MIAIDGLQLTVVPKIPQPHFLYIVSRSRQIPQFSTLPGEIQPGSGFAELICRWFVNALELVIAQGLLQDYREEEGEISTVRGRLRPLATGRLFYRGRMLVSARYEEFGFDHPLNRLLLGAARVVSAASFLPEDLRIRAARTVRQMPDVGNLVSSDRTAEADRSSAHYAVAILLAKQVLEATGRSLEVGASKTWTFLFRTAIPIEEGLRSILAEDLDPLSVTKASYLVGGRSIRAKPDLTFDGAGAIGDIKYKIGKSSWERTDLYQLVAFAAAAEVETAVLVDFRPQGNPALPTLRFGDISALNVSWPFKDCQDPEEARAWLVNKLMASLPASVSP